jgi:hypothetical protein
MGGHLQLEILEREEKEWEAVAQQKGFICFYCREPLTKDELKLYGNRCSRHQNGWDDED